MAPRLRSAVIRLRCAGERGAQSLEWLALGSFVVWAPFIPIWEKEWILPFAAALDRGPWPRATVTMRREPC